MSEAKGLTTKQKDAVQSLVNEEVKKINWLMGAVVIVLFIGVATMFVAVWGIILDATRFKTETYQDLVNKVNDQNYKIDVQNNKLETIETGLRKYKIIP